MDLIIVPSHHSKNVFLNTKFDKMDNNSKEKIGELKLDKPIEVLFEGLDTQIFKQLSTKQPSVSQELKNIKEDFCFLYVGHWLDGKLGHDRKDTGMLIKTFCKAFSEKRTKPALILKTSSATFSVLDRKRMLEKIRSITLPFGIKCPSIYLLHGDLTPEEVNGLYNHPRVKAHITFTKGEGFGRPLLEASVSGKPVIASAWSGQLDFLHKDMSILLPGELQEVHKSARWKGVINEGTHWFYVNYQNAERVIRDVYKSYKNYLPGARKQAYYSRTNFSMEKMTELFSSIIDKYVGSIPQQVPLTLPTLKKINKSQPTINLPKLKKV
jgi:glycosyltransferase involved in cell wall biosynthesis